MGLIFCIGGLEGLKNDNGEFVQYKLRKVDYEILNSVNMINPKVLFIGTASKEREDYYESFKKAYEENGAIVTKLNIINSNVKYEKIEKQILSADIIYVGCGKTQYMLDLWKDKGIDKLLKQAYHKGIILAGMSAGSYCWFQCNYDSIEGLGLINGINCVHYNKKDNQAREKF